MHFPDRWFIFKFTIGNLYLVTNYIFPLLLFPPRVYFAVCSIILVCNFPGLASLPLLRPSSECGKCRKSISNKIIKAQTPGNELRQGGEETGGARRLGATLDSLDRHHLPNNQWSAQWGFLSGDEWWGYMRQLKRSRSLRLEQIKATLSVWLPPVTRPARPSWYQEPVPPEYSCVLLCRGRHLTPGRVLLRNLARPETPGTGRGEETPDTSVSGQGPEWAESPAHQTSGTRG